MKMYTWAQVATAAKPMPQTCASGDYIENVSISDVAPDIPQHPSHGGNTISPLKKNDIDVYPNPTKNIVHVKLNLTQQGEVKVNLFDNIGRMVKTLITSNTAGEITFNLGDLTIGLYSYKLYLNNELLHTGKITLLK